MSLKISMSISLSPQQVAAATRHDVQLLPEVTWR